MRRCTKCRVKQPVSEFYLNRGKPVTVCKTCTKERTNTYYHANRDDYTERRHWIRVAKEYGVDREWFEATVKEQRGRCAICREKLELHDRRMVHIDHNHVTGKVRGILCCHCNRGLGGFRDSIKFMIRAIGYLHRHGKV